jgi:hypothetical protein
VLWIFHAPKNAALALPPEKRAGATGKQLQHGLVSRVDATFGHDVTGKLYSRHRPRRIPQRIQGCACHVTPDRPVGGAQDLLADALDIVTRIEDPNGVVRDYFSARDLRERPKGVLQLC